MSEYGKKTEEWQKGTEGASQGHMTEDLSDVKQCLEQALDKINKMSSQMSGGMQGQRGGTTKEDMGEEKQET